MTDYQAIRKALHAHPETAGQERFAHDLVVERLQQLHPTKVFTHVGGNGVIAVWGECEQDPTIAFRADTDALPHGHRCGHDGHTTILLRLAELVDEGKHQGMNIMLIWQPAEETGEGAAAILESGIIQRYSIRAIFGMHNLPGYPMGTVVLCRRTFAAASTGIIYHLQGRSTHASTPEMGINPGLAVAEIIQEFAKMNILNNGEFRQTTLICVRAGGMAFGTSAGEAEVMFTLRTFSNEAMEQLLGDANEVVDNIASKYRLTYDRLLQEPFGATENCEEMVDWVEAAADTIPLRTRYQIEPFRWSEDFGRYLLHFPGAMFGIGSGEKHCELHHPDYEFPDEIIEPTATLFYTIAKQAAERITTG